MREAGAGSHQSEGNSENCKPSVPTLFPPFCHGVGLRLCWFVGGHRGIDEEISIFIANCAPAPMCRLAKCHDTAQSPC